jgi:hypothetical protein
MAVIEKEFCKQITTERNDSNDLKSCIFETVEKLLINNTDVHKPGMLLGKIQSGKTRAFIGVVALAFDNGYDIAIILTKGTKVLARQTYERLKKDFYKFYQEDKVEICDVMHLPQNYTGYELRKKLIIVVKKETNNLKRIIKALLETYPDLSQRKLLIIDDEADYASIGFHMNRNEGVVEINKIAEQINDLRGKIASYDFLQVTATPYSLYLQPDELITEQQDKIFKPVRPAFTVLLPIYEGYIGGEYYFGESQDEDSPAFYIYQSVPRDELDILKGKNRQLGRADRRSFKLEHVLESPKIKILRKALINFIVGACIRRIQQEKQDEIVKKYSFIVHTESSKTSHAWQEEIIIKIKELLRQSVLNNQNQNILHDLIIESFSDISRSVKSINGFLPSFEEIVEKVNWILKEDCLMITKVNSEREAEELLDEGGQLRLRAPLNIFIGGQILDRGITIENLIGFYYGRRPQKFQQDTVLQHSRMYGNRSKEDLTVTRFYTDPAIYDAMKRIYELDLALREAFEKGAQEAGVAFIHTDPFNRVVPCSPNKILLSTTTTLKPFKRLLPVGFQTNYKTNIKNFLEVVDKTIEGLMISIKREEPFLIKIDIAKYIIDNIASMFNEDGLLWDVKAFMASMEYLSENTDEPSMKGKVWCLVRKDRNASRLKRDGSYYDAPDTAQAEGVIAKQTAIDIPMVMFFRQNGLKEQGWMGSPFWWPVLVAPKNTKTVIYSSNLIDVQPELESV